MKSIVCCLFFVCVLFMSACSFEPFFNEFPKTGVIQCPLGLQALGCKFIKLSVVSGAYIAECEVGGTLYGPVSQCLLFSGSQTALDPVPEAK